MKRYRLSLQSEYNPRPEHKYYRLEEEYDRYVGLKWYGAEKTEKAWGYETSCISATSWDDAMVQAKEYLDKQRAKEVKVVFEY